MSEIPFNLPTPSIKPDEKTEHKVEQQENRNEVSVENITAILERGGLHKVAKAAELVGMLGEAANDDQFEKKFDQVA